MSREEDVEAWKDYLIWKGAAAYWQSVLPVEDVKGVVEKPWRATKRTGIALKVAIENIRIGRRSMSVPPLPDVGNEPRNILGILRPRMTPKISFGGKPKGDLKSKTFVLSRLWTIYAFRELYSLGFEDQNWFLLSAKPFRVNAKRLEVYQCVAVNVRTGDNKEVYVARATVDEKYRFALAHSLENAVERMTTIMLDAVTNKISGEEKNDDSPNKA